MDAYVSINEKSIAAALSMCEHKIAPELMPVLDTIDAQAFVDLSGLARGTFLNKSFADYNTAHTDAVIPCPSPIITLANELDDILEKQAGMKESGADEATKTSVHVTVESQATVAAPAAPASAFGAWDKFRNGASTNTLGLSTALAANLDPEMIQKFGQAAMAMMCDAGGVDEAALKIAKRRQEGTGAKIKDSKARDKIFKYRRTKEGGNEYLASGERRNAWDGMGQILDTRFEQVIGASARFYGMRDEADALGDKASISVGGGKFNMSQVRGLLPMVAERISQRMIAGEIGENAGLVIEEYAVVLDILRNPAVQVASGVMPDQNNPTKSALELLDNEGMTDASNYLRLGTAYEELMNRLKLCPTNPDASYVMFVGEAASLVLTYAAMVDVTGASEVAPQEAPFRPQPVLSPDRPAEQTTRRGWKFNLKLQFGFHIGIG